ncbi:hypothetical protein PW52_02425 [Tamlana sedimentorum]|uniref:SdpI/YhfL protein family n=1 Tax=Neotamlana sedimentorum TaxID=1435349 RepID=A0A0D7WCU7_9FLAO|nr:SdpI family protein [Tamlana sedimentorum]KJD36528.1 hypothetical protein PW52_02425 [Tamlana sedimentorum]
MNLSFHNPLFFIPLVSGLIFISTGFVMLKFPPKKINGLYGYRTSSSMKNQERWDFSQKLASIEMIKLGAVLTLTSVIGLIFKTDDKIGMLLGLALMMLIVVFLIIRVENAIKKKFTKHK